MYKKIKIFIKRIIPRRYHSKISFLDNYLRSLFLLGFKYKCIFCKGHFRKLLPIGLKNNVTLNLIGRYRYALCPRCHRFEKLGITIIEKRNIFDFIKQSQLVVTNVSTAALDAMIIQKPVIIFNLLNLPEKFTKFGAGIIIKERGIFCKELENMLKKGFCDSELIRRQMKFANLFNKPNMVSNIVNLLDKVI